MAATDVRATTAASDSGGTMALIGAAPKNAGSFTPPRSALRAAARRAAAVDGRVLALLLVAAAPDPDVSSDAPRSPASAWSSRLPRPESPNPPVPASPNDPGSPNEPVPAGGEVVAAGVVGGVVLGSHLPVWAPVPTLAMASVACFCSAGVRGAMPGGSSA